MDSSLSFMGRVEVPIPDNTWGTICGNGWTTADASVICRQLGFRVGGVIARKKGGFGHGYGPVVLSKVGFNMVYHRTRAGASPQRDHHCP